MNPLKVALITALVTGTIAIVSSISGIWLGSRLTRANDDRKWRRESALEAYSDVLKASETVHFVAIAAYIADCNSEKYAKHVLLIRDAVAELHGVVDRALLLSPKEMYDDLRSLVSYCTGELGANAIKCPKIAKTEWDKIQGAHSTYDRPRGDETESGVSGVEARDDLGELAKARHPTHPHCPAPQ
jgi:hypothetical protein